LLLECAFDRSAHREFFLAGAIERSADGRVPVFGFAIVMRVGIEHGAGGVDMIFVAAPGERAVAGFSMEVLVADDVHVVTGLALGIARAVARCAARAADRPADPRITLAVYAQVAPHADRAAAAATEDHFLAARAIHARWTLTVCC